MVYWGQSPTIRTPGGEMPEMGVHPKFPGIIGPIRRSSLHIATVVPFFGVIPSAYRPSAVSPGFHLELANCRTGFCEWRATAVLLPVPLFGDIGPLSHPPGRSPTCAYTRHPQFRYPYVAGRFHGLFKPLHAHGPARRQETQNIKHKYNMRRAALG